MKIEEIKELKTAFDCICDTDRVVPGSVNIGDMVNTMNAAHGTDLISRSEKLKEEVSEFLAAATSVYVWKNASRKTVVAERYVDKWCKELLWEYSDVYSLTRQIESRMANAMGMTQEEFDDAMSAMVTKKHDVRKYDPEWKHGDAVE